jgi:hypothetical protein
MTLGDLTLPITYEEAHQYAMVFSVDLAQRLAEPSLNNHSTVPPCR